MRLREPRQDAAVVGRIVRQGVGVDELAVGIDAKCTAPAIRVGHRIGVGVLAGVVEALAEHVVHIDGSDLVVFDILAVQTFSGDFRAEDGGLARLRGQFEFIFEEAFASAVDFQSVEDVPLLLRPFGLREILRCDANDAVFLRFFRDSHECREIAGDDFRAILDREADGTYSRNGWQLDIDSSNVCVHPGSCINGDGDFLGGAFRQFALFVPIADDGGDGELAARVFICGKGDEQRDGAFGTRLETAAELAVQCEIRIRMQVVERHAWENLLDARVFRRAVETDVTVPFVADVMVLRVEPARTFRMAAEGVHHEMVVP